jgi:hypothetical protein
MAEVRNLFGGPTQAPEPPPACVEVLEAWLEKARSGQIVGVLLVGQCRDGSVDTEVDGRLDGCQLIGALELAKADIVEVMRDA